MLKYREIVDGIFLEFPNHFITYVGVNGTVETATTMAVAAGTAAGAAA